MDLPELKVKGIGLKVPVFSCFGFPDVFSVVCSRLSVVSVGLELTTGNLLLAAEKSSEEPGWSRSVARRQWSFRFGLVYAFEQYFFRRDETLMLPPPFQAAYTMWV